MTTCRWRAWEWTSVRSSPARVEASSRSAQKARFRVSVKLALVAGLTGACGGRLLSDGVESTRDAGDVRIDAGVADVDAGAPHSGAGGPGRDAGKGDGTVTITIELDAPATIVSIGLVSARCAPPPGATFPTQCTVVVPRGLPLSLRAAPGVGYHVDRWTKCPNAAGDVCRLTPDANARLAVSLATCPARAPSADPVYVDAISGVDDPKTGGGVGVCAFKTVTYALAHAVSGISVAPGSYPSLGEPTPLTLTGTQSLVCAPGATFVNQDPTPGVGLVAIAGTSNLVTGCNFDDAVLQGTAIRVKTSGLSGAPHRIERLRCTRAFSQGVLIDPAIDHVAIQTARFERGYVGIEVGAGDTDITVADLSFDLINLGVYCHDATVNVPTLFAKCVGCQVPSCP